MLAALRLRSSDPGSSEQVWGMLQLLGWHPAPVL